MSRTTKSATIQSTPESATAHYWRWEDPQHETERAGAAPELAEGNRISTLRIDDAESERLVRIEEIRAELSAGSYDTDRKLEIALDRMIDALTG